MAVIDGGDIAWARGYGVRDADHPDAVTSETVFQAGSVSKPVAAMAALRLVEEGRLTLDDDIGRWLTSWRVPSIGSWQPRLTLRQLLSHTAGLTVHGFQGYDRDTVLPTLVQVLDGAEPANSAPVRVDLIPGAQFRYSGGGYCVLQQVLVDVTGQPFPDLMRDLVLAPLGMAHSTYAQPLPTSWRQRAASGHQPGGAPVEGCWAVYPEMAAAGLWTTPSDLARVALDLQRALARRPGTLLSPEMVRMMLAPQFDQPTDDLDERIGLGFFLRGEGQAAQFRHTGSDRGFLCLFSGYERLGAGIVAMINARRRRDPGVRGGRGARVRLAGLCLARARSRRRDASRRVRRPAGLLIGCCPKRWNPVPTPNGAGRLTTCAAIRHAVCRPRPGGRGGVPTGRDRDACRARGAAGPA